MYVIDRCPCCSSTEFLQWPAIVSPFIARYACGASPGPANLCECQACTFRFFDTRLSSEEVAKLYGGYRGDEYFKARHNSELWYSRKVNDSIGGDPAEIISRKRGLERRLGAKAQTFVTVLDYGGDRGQFIPNSLGRERFVFEISDVEPVEGVTRLSSVEGRQFDFVMVAHVLEHCSEPGEFLRSLKPLGHKDTIFYIEVPYERPSLKSAGTGEKQRRYLNALLRMEPLLQLVDLYSTICRIKLDKIPPLGLQKCSEHLNFFNQSSLKALLKSEGFESLESDVVPFEAGEAGNRTILNRILYGLARKV
jgi:Methyltransferase domain